MELLQTSIVVGVTLGLVYALSGVGLVIIFRASGYVSFTQGDIAAVSLYVGLAAHNAGLPYVLVALVVIVCGCVLGGFIGSVLIVPLERFGHLAAALGTVAVGLTIQGVESLTLNSTPRSFPSAGKETVLTIGSVALSRADVVAVIVTVVLFGGLGLAFRLSKVGISMRAANDNPVAAAHVGVSSRALKNLSWVIAGGVAGVAGLFIAPMYSLSPTSINALLLFGFASIVLGGLESIFGALIGGMLIGITSNVLAAYVSPQLVAVGVYVLVLVVLLARPHGMLGRRPLVRV